MKKKQEMIFPFLLGFSSLIAQTIILRAFQTVFYGNELSYAVLLSSWLLWVALGSLFATLISAKIRLPNYFLIISFCVLALGIPVGLFGIRYIKPILDVGAGQMLGIPPMIISAFVLTAVLGFFVGAIFVLLCYPSDQQQSTGRIYLWESFGSGIGGIIFSLILLRIFNVTMIAWILSSLIILVLVIFSDESRRVRLFLLGLLILVTAFLYFDVHYNLDYVSQQKQYPFAKLITVQDSPYANIAVVKREENYSIYQNGLLSFTANDLLSAEENVHFALLAHPNPQRVLLIGNGLGGEIAQILKYPNLHIDFVEIDKDLIDISRKYLPRQDTAVLDNDRVSVHLMDARRFVRITANKYDVVIVNVGDPYTAGLNRYYTLEFFEELNRILNTKGIASFRVSSSENFLSEENRVFLRSLYWTMKKVFPDVRSIPGDTHTFLVSNVKGTINIHSDWLVERLRKIGLKNRFLNEYTLPFRVTDERVNQVEQILNEKKGLLNTDLFPRSYLFQTILWSTHFSSDLKRFIASIDVPFWVIVLSVSVLILLVGLWKTYRQRLGCVGLAVATTGFSEIIFQVIVILAFQSLYGTAYDKIALILASFMLGLVAGSHWANKRLGRPLQEQLNLFTRTQLGIVIYPVFLPVIFVLFRDAQIFQHWIGFFAIVFASLPFIAGFLGGVQYPLATVMKERIGGEKDRYSGGILYAIDVLGASIGALLTGVILIPLYGIVAVCALCVIVNGIVYFFCLIAGKH